MLRFIGVALSAVVLSASAANALVVRCGSSPTGYCNVMPVPAPHIERRPQFGVNVGVGAPVNGDVDRYNEGTAGDGRCPGGAWEEEIIQGCIKSGGLGPTLANDDRCSGKPPGFKFDVPVTGPHGEAGFDHRVCGVRR